jgi:hypothetical protein
MDVYPEIHDTASMEPAYKKQYIKPVHTYNHYQKAPVQIAAIMEVLSALKDKHINTSMKNSTR